MRRHAHDRALDQAQRRVDDLRARHAMVSPALFYATTTAHRDRKAIRRSLVERVRVTAKNAETISATITWTDGSEPTVCTSTDRRNGRGGARECRNRTTIDLRSVA
jgi:hypothetical protein